MPIRAYQEGDLDRIRELHAKSGLPPECFPDLTNPLYFVKVIAETRNRITQAGFIKLTGEAYVLLDHEASTAQQRYATLNSLVAHGLGQAAAAGLNDVSCWVPPTLERSFGKRLEAVGFIKSPWPAYTALLE